jgi:hypothetical protein
MAYFSNGTEGLEYEAKWCATCVHSKPHGQMVGCTVWLAHLLYNYAECNNPQSVLHVLIPRSKDALSNLKCTMHITREEVKKARQVPDGPELF